MIIKNHVMIAALAVASLTSCEKEISAASSKKQQPSNSASITYKFKETVQVYSDNREDGYVDLTVSSDNQAFLKDYTDKLRESKLVFVEESGIEEGSQSAGSVASNDPTEWVAIDMNWNNFDLKLEKGKNFKIGFVPKNQQKTLTLSHSVSGIIAWTSTMGYGAVTVYNTYSYWNFGKRTSQTATWSWSGTGSNNNFYLNLMDTDDNLEVRTFTSSDPYWSGSGSGALTSNGFSGYYRPRKNYISGSMPGIYEDRNMIVAGSGSKNNNPGEGAPANVTFHIAS